MSQRRAARPRIATVGDRGRTGAQSLAVPGPAFPVADRRLDGVLRHTKPEEGKLMAKYLFEAKYTAEGAKGVARDGGTGRRAAIEKAVAGIGGRLETFYFAFGSTDVYVIVDLPDNVSAAALGLAVGQSGLASTKTTVLLTVEEVDAATKKSVAYRPPGG
jgi:uncharacterized protein with GYD domain